MNTKVNGSRKGRNYERDIAKDLSLWWSNGKRNDVFYHTHGSGSIGTRRNPVSKNYYGDIMSIDAEGEPFTNLFNLELKCGYEKRRKVELKSGKKIVLITRYDLLDKLDSKQAVTVIEDFWIQCSLDAKKSKREPILIFQRHRRNSLICCNCISKLPVQYKACPRITFGNLSFTSLNCFCETITPQMLIKSFGS